MSVNKERVQLLVDALRSGELPQGKGALRSEDGYCCLGVATLVAIENGLPIEEAGGNQWSDIDKMIHPTDRVAHWYGFDIESQDGEPPIPTWNPELDFSTCRQEHEHHESCSNLWHAAEANDDGVPFSEIADAFYRTYIKGDQ